MEFKFSGLVLKSLDSMSEIYDDDKHKKQATNDIKIKSEENRENLFDT